MNKRTKWDIEKVRKLFEDNGCTLLETHYKKALSKIRFICSCGNQGERNLVDFKESPWCKICSNKKKGDAKRLSFDNVKKIFERGGCKLLATEYINSETPLAYLCECGNKTSFTIGNFKKGQRCKECGKKKQINSQKMPFIEVKKFFEDAGCVLLSTNEYINAKKPLLFICKCGNFASKSYDSFKRGSHCKNCRYKKMASTRRRPLELVIKIFEDEGCKLLATDYKNSETSLSYICSCGRKSSTSLSFFIKGVRCKICGLEKNTGKNNWKWNPNLTDEQRLANETRTKDPRHRKWSFEVKKRDKFTCKCCGDNSGKNLNAHHICNFNEHKDLRYDINNGVTLCESCHIKFHVKYGYQNNNKEQLKEFLHG